ncbi:MAG: zinc-dependent metalloprotease [Marinifilaceae bacterium]
MKNSLRSFWLLLCVVFMSHNVVMAMDADMMFFGKKKKKSEAKEQEKTVSEFEKIVKDGEQMPGALTVYKVKNDYYFEIPDSLLQRDFLIVNKVSAVTYELNDAGLNKGMEYHDQLIRFYKDADLKKVWVTTYNPRVSVPAEDAIAASVRSNYRESVIEQFPIEAYSADSTSVLIKVNKVFDGSEKSFNDVYNDIALGVSVKKDLSKIMSIKSFPENVVVKAMLTSQVKEGNATVPITVETTTNVVLLPEQPMRPRIADKRVGFFTTPHVYFNDKQHKAEPREFVNRWRLEPKAEDLEKYLSGELVEPKKPIIYYIDPSTPKQWIEPIKAGVVDWNEAFEAAGFKNAIQIREVAADDADFDLDDVRYSVITYAASEQMNAMGPSVVDPRSGEIIEADVVWWHNVMSLLHTWMRVQTSPIDERARANKLSDEHMGDAIRFVSSHEVGHTFGLKHNMGASWAFPTDSLRSPYFTEKMGGTASSIMDYARFNYVAQPGDGVKEITPKIGVYDKHAINWAYRWLNVNNEHEELLTLNEWITRHDGDRMYWYGEQQDPKNPIDPRSQDEDLGDDIVKSNRYGIANLKRIVPNIVAWTEQEGEDYTQAGRLLMAVVNQWKMYASHVTANVGGFYVENPVKGSDFNRFEPVEKARQKESVQYLIEEVVQVPEWLFQGDIWKKSFPIQMGVEYGAYNVARELQYAVMYDLLKDERILRMLESQTINGEKSCYTPEELFADLHKAAFKGSLRGGKLSLFERMTQKNYIDAIIVSSNKTVEKTTKKRLAHHANCGCSFASKSAELDIQQMAKDRELANMHVTSMNRVSESVSVKRGALLKVLRLAEQRRNDGDTATRNHYEDLIIRVREALNLD